ncbi:MAG TPA: PPOX class F420-dependent oxidoreductase [Candidatus Lokiarchaeia archaeon]|nr:PPOX class F420-dependent oxidoreductase [Candidatus Lokiarchaeia archaeon]
MVDNLEDDLSQFRGQKYLSLMTTSKAGKNVATPVWFAENEWKFYVSTPKTAYKLKRIQNDPSVQFAPCTQGGKVRGTYVSGSARIVPEEDSQPLWDLFRRKYGVFYTIWANGFGQLFRKKKNRVPRLRFIEITTSG